MEASNDTAGLTSGVDTYVPSIDGPLPGAESMDQNAAPSDTAEQPSEQPSEAADQEPETTGAEQPSYSKDPILNHLIQQFAKDHPYLDPANADHLKILNQLANKEKFIRELKSGSQKNDGLTEFERSLQVKPAAGEPTSQPAAQPAAAQPESKAYFEGDPGVSWKSPNDAYAQLAQTWAKEGGPDFEQLNKIDQGIFLRRAQAFGYVTADQAQKLFDRILQERLGDVLPSVRESVAAQRDLEDKEFAFEQLEKVPEWSSVRELEKEVEGPPVKFGDREFPNTRLNQILAANPEILDIYVKDQNNPNRIDSRLTYIARYRAAMRIGNMGQIDAKKASQFVKAGESMAERENRDRARRGLNSGTGATGLPNGKKIGSVVQSMLNDDGPSSFANL